jgi:hypothetical protein
MESSNSLLCLAWNAGGLSLCGTDTGSQGVKAHIAGVTCVIPDFMGGLNEYIAAVTTVIISTEDEIDNSTYFHSKYLPSFMNQRGFKLIAREKTRGSNELSGVSNRREHSVNYTLGTALRLSIYIRNGTKVNVSTPVIVSDEVSSIDSPRFVHRMSSISLRLNYAEYSIDVVAVCLGAPLVKLGGDALVDELLGQSRAFLQRITSKLSNSMTKSNLILLGDFGAITRGDDDPLLGLLPKGTVTLSHPLRPNWHLRVPRRDGNPFADSKYYNQGVHDAVFLYNSQSASSSMSVENDDSTIDRPIQLSYSHYENYSVGNIQRSDHDAAVVIVGVNHF